MDAITLPPVIRLSPEDGVVIARVALPPGAPVTEGVSVRDRRIPPGHKVATRAHLPGEPVRRYGQIIGFATQPIAPGDWVHTHNLAMGDFSKDYAWGADARPTEYVNPPATFLGIRRADGRVATRNYIGLITSVNCSAHVADLIADAFRRNPFRGSEDPLTAFPNVDGVVALTHKTGCGMTAGSRCGCCAARWPALRGTPTSPTSSPSARLRGEPVGWDAGGAAAGRTVAEHGYPGDGRHAEDGGSRRRLREGSAGRGECRHPRARAGKRVGGGAAMRRLGRLFGHHRQPCARRRVGSGGAARWHGDSLRDAGDLWRRTPADAPRRLPRGGREAGGQDAVVGGVRRARARR